MPATFGTVVNPTRRLAEYLSTHASNSLAKSLVAVATPQFAGELQQLQADFPRLQTVGFSCDTVPLGCQRAGFSWLISENPIDFIEKKKLEADTSRNWSESTAAVRLTTPSKTDLAVFAANTLFTTGHIAEIYAGDDVPLAALHFELGDVLKPQIAIRPAKSLSDWMEITGCTDNMLKTLNNERAAQVLEDRPDLQMHVDPQVFAELSSGEMVRVVAGGGGLWSPRASMLVLEAPCTLHRGDKLRFWLETPLDNDMVSQLANTPENGMVVEVAPVPQSIEDEKLFLEYKRNHYVPLFGFGSERGFLVGDNRHSIVGESLYCS